MKRKIAIFAIVAVALAAGFFFYGGQQTPAGQPALLSLNVGNFLVLKESFNSAPRSVHLIAMLSPT